MPHIDTETLRRMLEYSPDTGNLTWQTRPVEDFISTRVALAWNAKYAGKRAGTTTPIGRSGHYIIINKQPFVLSRIVWQIMNGKPPPNEIDHRDGNNTNNRWDNLRLASRTRNNQNKGEYRNNTSGFKGVTRHGNKWRARIGIDGKKVSLGVFEDPAKAHAAYKTAMQAVFGEFARAS